MPLKLVISVVEVPLSELVDRSVVIRVGIPVSVGKRFSEVSVPIVEVPVSGLVDRSVVVRVGILVSVENGSNKTSVEYVPVSVLLGISISVS